MQLRSYLTTPGAVSSHRELKTCDLDLRLYRRSQTQPPVGSHACILALPCHQQSFKIKKFALSKTSDILVFTNNRHLSVSSFGYLHYNVFTGLILPPSSWSMPADGASEDLLTVNYVSMLMNRTDSFSGSQPSSSQLCQLTLSRLQRLRHQQRSTFVKLLVGLRLTAFTWTAAFRPTVLATHIISLVIAGLCPCFDFFFFVIDACRNHARVSRRHDFPDSNNRRQHKASASGDETC